MDDLFEIIYNDDNLIVVGKKQGIAVQPDKTGDICLIDIIKERYGASCELCHRIDRNTGGIVLIAKNQETLKTIEDAIADNKIRKSYKAVLCGKLRYPEEVHKSSGVPASSSAYHRLTYYHFKDAKENRVFIYDQPRKLTKKIITDYRILAYDERSDTTLIEARLVTGRTHQIRAQFAYLGHAVAGDGKYGKNADNKKLSYKYQALWAYKVELGGVLKNIGVPDVFVYPPDFK